MSAELFGPPARVFVRFAGVRRGMAVLDMACGSGVVTREAARAAGPGGRVVAADFSPTMAALARDAAPAARVAVMDAQRPALGKGVFDAVLCHLGLMLLARPDAALRGMVRAARPGGVVACAVQGSPDRMLFTSLALRAAAGRLPELRAGTGPGIYDFAPPGRLAAALRKAGLERVAVRRLRGGFRFASPEAYWRRLSRGAGRLRTLLSRAAPAVRSAVRRDVLAAVAPYRRGKRLCLPFELVLARGVRL